MVTTDPTISYTLDAAQLATLRAGVTRPPRDPVTQREFVAGDRVVFCGATGCGLPIHLDTWRSAGNRCPCLNGTPTTTRNLELDSPGYRPPPLRIFRPRRQTLPQPEALQRRIWRACLAEAMLVLIAFVTWQIWLGIYNLPHTWHPEGIVWLLLPFIALFILLPVFVVYTFACLAGAVLLLVGAVLIVLNVFSSPAAYVDPVDRVWAMLTSMLAAARNRF